MVLKEPSMSSNVYTLKPINGFTVRWRQAGDIDAFMEIETHSSECLWAKEDFLAVFREANMNCFVVTKFGTVVGFLIYEIGRKCYHILNLSVHPDYRRCGVGRILLNKLKSKITEDKAGIRFDVRETNLIGHLFLKANGFRAEKILYSYFVDYYTDADDEVPEKQDAYSFRYRLGSKSNIKERLCTNC